MPNNLANETSPYLRQHKDNPVNWYPWGETAISRAKQEQKPIFLSIGYAACHWCHIMAHESFEDPQTAAILNQNFIAIKVDREERPDLDDIYMQAVVLLTGNGGWPLSVFLTPDLQPFYGGTYFPPEPQFRIPSFKQVLLSIINAWQNDPENLHQIADSITKSIHKQQTLHDSNEAFPDLDAISEWLISSYDWDNGGWGHAPKFPQPMVIEFLIQRAYRGDKHAYHLVEHYLNHLSMGGLYDLVGGGFHRYSTDEGWLIPHFEKMLYDNVQLALVFTHGFALTEDITFKWIAEHTLDFVLHMLSHPEGGFYASLDADTPEGEGRYYVWREETLKDVLSLDEFSWLKRIFSLSEEGNFEMGLNILQAKYPLSEMAEKLHLTKSEFIAKIEPILFKLRVQRQSRIPPTVDDKIITSWNSLAISAFVQAGLLFGRQDYIEASQSAIDFLLENLIAQDGKILRAWSRGKSNQIGSLEDYAGLILALGQIYQVNFSPMHYKKMRTIYQKMEEMFSSEDLFYNDAAFDVPHLILQPRNLQDNVTPSGNALVCHVRWLIDQLEGFPEHAKNNHKILFKLSTIIQQFPLSFGYWLKIADLISQPTQQIALISSTSLIDLEPFLRIYHHSYNPYRVIAAKINQEDTLNDAPGLCHNRFAINEKITAYICQDFTCKLPITDIEDFKQSLLSTSQ